jgi:hypothetical protein
MPLDPISLTVAAIVITSAGIAVAVISFDTIKKYIKRKLKETVWFFWNKIKSIILVEQELPPETTKGMWNYLKTGDYATIHRQSRITAFAINHQGEIAGQETFTGAKDAETEKAFSVADFYAGKRVIQIQNS